MNKFKIEWTIIIALLLFLFLSINTCNRNKNMVNNKQDLLETMYDSLYTYRNQSNEQVAIISVLETEKTESFTKIQNLSGDLKKLQDLVKENSKKLKKQGSVTILTTETSLTDTVETNVVYADTVYQDSFIYIYPEYLFDIQKEQWINISGVATRDTTVVDVLFENDYVIVIGKDKNGLFKKSKTFVEVTNKNPYSTTTTLRTYQVSLPKPKRFGIGPSIGYGINGSLNGTIQHGFQIGIGLNYNLIEF